MSKHDVKCSGDNHTQVFSPLFEPLQRQAALFLNAVIRYDFDRVNKPPSHTFLAPVMASAILVWVGLLWCHLFLVCVITRNEQKVSLPLSICQYPEVPLKKSHIRIYSNLNTFLAPWKGQCNDIF